jgi:hypothetical protein
MDQGNFDELMNLLEQAYKDNNVSEVNRINNLIMNGLEVVVSESSLDYEFIESIRGKTVFKSLVKLVREDTMDKHDVLKLFSSLVTHLVIESDLKKKDIKNYPIMMDRMVVDERVMVDAKKFICDRYKRFI